MGLHLDKHIILAKMLFGILFTSAMNILEVFAEIPTESIDYWIGNISPRCTINIIYYEFSNDFILKSPNNIPVMWAPLKFYEKPPEFYRTRGPFDYFNYMTSHKFYNSAMRFMKAECFFSILYYKLPKNFAHITTNNIYLYDMITYIAYGFPNINEFESNSTYCLILYHGSERIDDIRFQKVVHDKREMNIALVYLPNSSKSGYNVYCKTPSMKFQLAAMNIANEVYSFVNQNFIITCSSQYTFVAVNEQRFFGDYASERSGYEHHIVAFLVLKANVSILEKHQRTNCRSCTGTPRVIVSDIEYSIQASSFFLTFDDSIRFFTCYSLPVLSFHFYVSAFEIKVWVAKILSVIVIATFLKFHIHYNLSKTSHFSTWLFYFSILTEESYSIPSSIGNNKVFRIATILWLLTSIVLTTTYISHVISGLNAPLEGEKIKNSDFYGSSSPDYETDIRNIIVYHYDLMMDLQTDRAWFLTEFFNSFLDELHRNQTSTSGYTILSESFRLPYQEDVWLNLKNPFMYTVFFDNLLKLDSCDRKFFGRDSTFCRTLTNLMRHSNKYYPAEHTYKRPWKSSYYPTGAVEEELIKCEKSVYVEESDQLEFKYMSENCRNKRFYYLRDKFSITQKKWGFLNLQKSKLPFYFSMFLQSGIFHEMHKLELFSYHQKRRSITSEIIKRTHKREVLDMTTSVQTVFILFVVMILVANLAFIAEFGFYGCNMNNILFFKRELAKIALGAKFSYHAFKKRKF